jgi:MFS family permease
LIVVLGGVLTLARFSEAFLVLRAAGVGLEAASVPLVLVVMNVVYALSAYPAGVAADRMSRRTLLTFGLGALIAADLILAAAATTMIVFVGVGLWGLHMGLTQGLLATLVAATAPASLRGTAFGIFNLATGVLLLLASVVAGLLWTHLGPSVTFLAGSCSSVPTANPWHQPNPSLLRRVRGTPILWYDARIDLAPDGYLVDRQAAFARE